MRSNEDEEIEVFGYDIGDSAYRIKDIVFEIMLSGVTSIPGIVMELNRQGIQGKEWKPVDVRGVLAGD
jgi:hypothetical protein